MRNSFSLLTQALPQMLTGKFRRIVISLADSAVGNAISHTLFLDFKIQYHEPTVREAWFIKN